MMIKNISTDRLIILAKAARAVKNVNMSRWKVEANKKGVDTLDKQHTRNTLRHFDAALNDLLSSLQTLDM